MTGSISWTSLNSLKVVGGHLLAGWQAGRHPEFPRDNGDGLSGYDGSLEIVLVDTRHQALIRRSPLA